MKQTITNWLMKHRTAIGYTIGALNVLSGLSNIAIGNVVSGAFWVGIGAVIIYDVRTYK
jgi:formate/nitrite transporter FocA (FNT family)